MITRNRFISLVALTIVALGTFGCGGVRQQRGASMTTALIESTGTHVFVGKRTAVFKAAEGALRALGYPIAYTSLDAGVINDGSQGSAHGRGVGREPQPLRPQQHNTDDACHAILRAEADGEQRSNSRHCDAARVHQWPECIGSAGVVVARATG